MSQLIDKIKQAKIDYDRYELDRDKRTIIQSGSISPKQKEAFRKREEELNEKERMIGKK